jgi:hypothetical protein
MLRLVPSALLVAVITLLPSPESGAGAAQKEDHLVSLSLDRAPLTKVVSELTRQSGVRHGVTPEGQRQDVVIYCKDEPAAAVRAAISNLLGWTWTRGSDNGDTTYTLVKGQALLRQEAELRAQAWRKYTDMLRMLVAAVNDPAVMERLNEPQRHDLSLFPGKAMVRALGSLPEKIASELMAGKPVLVTGRTIAPEIEAVVRSISEAGQAEGGSALDLGPSDALRFGIATDGRGRPASLQLAVWRGGQVRLFYNCGFAQYLDEEFQTSPAARDSRLKEHLKQAPELAIPLAVMPPMEWPQPPEPEPSYIGWQLKDLARREPCPFPIIADCYPAMEDDQAATHPQSLFRPPFRPPQNNGRPFYAPLEDLRNIPRYDWRVQDKWGLVRYRDWYWEPVRTAPQPLRDGVTRHVP